MRKTLTILLFLVLAPYSYSQAPLCNITTGIIIAQQDFEITPPTNNYPYTLSSNINYSTGVGNFPNTNMFVSGSRGVQISNSGVETITFDTIDVSKYENIELTVRVAAFSTTSAEGNDTSDRVWIRIFNPAGDIIGNNWSKVIHVQGKNNGDNIWSFGNAAPIPVTPYDGDGNSVIFQPPNNGDVSNTGYSTIRITDITPTNDLRIEIKAKTSNTNEIWVIDDVILTGDQKDYLVWDNTDNTWRDNAGNTTSNVPNATTKAFFDTNYNMNSSSKPSIEACECEVASSKQVTIRNNKYLKIGNDIINNGTIKVLSEGSIVQINDAQVKGSGIFKIEKTTTPYVEYDFTYWSSPIESADLHTVFADNISGTTSRIFDFTTANFSDGDGNSYDDDNNDWNVKSGTMTPAKGYIAMGSQYTWPFDSSSYDTNLTQNVSFEGKINNGTITIPVTLDGYTYSGTGTDYSSNHTNDNLIGNPYPSAIDGEAFINANSLLTGTLYFWTHHTPLPGTPNGTAASDDEAYNFSNSDYATFTTAGYAASASGSTVPNDKEIASCQGFFAPVTAAGNITFTNAMRVTMGNDNFFRPQNNQRDRVWVNFTGENNMFRQVLVGFFTDATNGHDRLFDGKRMFSGTQNTDFYTLLNNERYAIQGLPLLTNDVVVPLGINTTQTADFTISIDRFEGDLENTNIYLKDNLLNTLHDLKIADYTFTANQIGEINNRFELVFSRNALATDNVNITSTKLIIAQNENYFSLRTSDNSVIKSASVYNMLGQELGFYTTKTNSLSMHTNNISAGSILIIKTTLENGNTISKKVIKM